jgi:hypothetical protein
VQADSASMKSAFSLTVHGGAGDLDIVQHGEIADIIEPEGGRRPTALLRGAWGIRKPRGRPAGA